MAQLIFKNNAQSTLAGSISNTATSIQLAAGTGILFPSPAAGQYFVATLIDAATGLVNEIVWCTQMVGDIATVVRAQEGTTNKPWNANDAFAELWTAGQAGQMLQQGQNQAQSGNYGTDVGSQNAVRVVLNPPLTSPIPGMPIRVLIANTNTGDSTLDPGPGPAQIMQGNGVPLPPNALVANFISEFAWNGTKYELIAPNLAQAIAPGTVAHYAGSNPPGGWLFCDGSSQVQANFPALFAVIGTIYGSVDGTHFNLPDVRGRVIATLDGGVGRLTTASINTPNALAGVGGAQSNSASISGTASGTLSVSTSVSVGGSGSTGGENVESNANSGPGGSFNFPAVGHAHNFSVNSNGSGSGSASGNMGVSGGTASFIIVQPTIMMNTMIKT
jgi:microcystin-dependent protein